MTNHSDDNTHTTGAMRDSEKTAANPGAHSSTLTEVDVLIVGQGICGSLLSWYLQKEGLTFLIIDVSKPHTASKAAAGVINPVTGRRLVKTWMIDELLPFARQAYEELGTALNQKLFSDTQLVEFFPTSQMRQAFLQRFAEDRQYLSLPDSETDWNPWFNQEFGFGVVNPCCLVDVQQLLSAYRKRLIHQGQLVDASFDVELLVHTQERLEYGGLAARKLVFCDGIESANSPFFSRLPFAPNKGEALIIRAEGIPQGPVFKKSMTLVPLGDDHFWVGSSYEWSFETDLPTAAFRERTSRLLEGWLKAPFSVQDHIASVRPATIERRPFAGFHPIHKNIGLLNGMGSKGCSLAPYVAHQLARHISRGEPLAPEASISRFTKILTTYAGGSGG